MGLVYWHAVQYDSSGYHMATLPTPCIHNTEAEKLKQRLWAYDLALLGWQRSQQPLEVLPTASGNSCWV